MRLVLIRKHLPGRHDQSTHGRGWNGGEGRRRDSRGRFSNGSTSPASNSESLGGGVSRKVEAPRRTLAQWYDDHDPFPSPADPGDARDPLLLEIWRRQGFAAKPEHGDEARLQQEIAAGGVEVWRGVSGADSTQYAEQFLSGEEPFPGLGIFGNGTYTSTEREIAVGYARNVGKLHFGSGPESGSMIRAVVRHDARKIDMEDLRELVKKSAAEHLQAYFASEGPGSERFEQLVRVQKIMEDPGRLASMLGYDVIIHRFPGVDDEYVILNRTAVVVQSEVIEVAPQETAVVFT